MNITHDNDDVIPVTMMQMRAITAIKSGDFVVIRDNTHKDEVAVAFPGDDFENHSALYLNRKGIRINSFAKINSTEVIFLTKNFDTKI
jgi:hypothetical protein